MSDSGFDDTLLDPNIQRLVGHFRAFGFKMPSAGDGSGVNRPYPYVEVESYGPAADVIQRAGFLAEVASGITGRPWLARMMAVAGPGLVAEVRNILLVDDPKFRASGEPSWRDVERASRQHLVPAVTNRILDLGAKVTGLEQQVGSLENERDSLRGALERIQQPKPDPRLLQLLTSAEALASLVYEGGTVYRGPALTLRNDLRRVIEQMRGGM